MKQLIHILLIAIFLSSCSSSKLMRSKDARDDAEKMKSALAAQAQVQHQIQVDAETEPVNAELGQDAADDPAIYRNPANPEKSIIIGTNKKKGLHTYNLQGEELDFVQVGKVNNVNVETGFSLGGREIILVSASNRTTQGISLFELNPTNGQLTQVGEIKTSDAINDIYGYATYKSPVDATYYALANGKNGVIEQYKLFEKNGEVKGVKVRTRRVKSQPEGMVVDTVTQKLYVGVEEFYIRIFDADPTKATKLQVIESSKKDNNSFIEYDIEGLALFNYKDNAYLIASIQGSFTYAIFDVTNPNNTSYVTSFALKGNGEVDGVEETDGLEVVTGTFGRNYPEGILVVQDGFNKNGNNDEAQNFKIIDLRKILEILP